MPSAPATKAEELVAAGRAEDAARLLFGGSADRDADALFLRAMWRISGQIVRRDLAAARDLLRRAGEGGRRDAALLHAYFLASGTGGAADWPVALSRLRELARTTSDAAAQLRLIEAMDIDRDGRPMRLPDPVELSRSPAALAFPALLSSAECGHLRAAGAPRLQPSVVVDPASGRMVPHPVRTSSGMSFGVFDEDLVVNAVNRRIAAASRTELAQGEPLQLLHYGPGHQYRAHMDALPAEPNQRILTMICYLNDGYEGGETRFLRTGLSFRGSAGDALLFRNVTSDGRPDPMAEHAGLPVKGGVKLLASRWIRQRTFVAPDPNQPVA